MKHKYFWFAIALAIVLVVLVDAKPAKTGTKKTGKHTGGKAGGKKRTGKKKGVKKVTALLDPDPLASDLLAPAPEPAAPLPPAPVAPAPVAPAPVVPAPVAAANPVDFLNNPAVSGIISRIGSGEKLTTAEMIPLMLIGLESGVHSTNPALSSLAATINETAAALAKSKTGTLSTGQMVMYSNRMLVSLGNATDTSKENMAKIKGCMAKGMAQVNFTNMPAVFGLIQNCSQFFGNGTDDGNLGAMKLITVFLPDGIRQMVESPGVLNLLDAVSNMATRNSGGISLENVDTAGLTDVLGSMAKGAGLNIDFSQMLGNFNFG